MEKEDVIILGIESSCDDTAAAVTLNGKILSNITAGQEIHRKYGGVVPELASRAHQQHIIPVVDEALKVAGIDKNQLDAVAFTRGPGLIGSLLVGSSFAKGMALGLGLPLFSVNHMQAHVIANFASRDPENHNPPPFPFLCLTVSGGHTQIVLVEDFLQMKVIGQTLDDAAGEAFDKIAKLIGLPYPGGPELDLLSRSGNSSRFTFPKPSVPGLDYSFSGFKTAVMYFLDREKNKNENFIQENLADICASVQKSIIAILMQKLEDAVTATGIKNVAIAGGVSANSGLRKILEDKKNNGWNVFIPAFEFCTDNAGMIALYAYYRYLNGPPDPPDIIPVARFPF